MGRRFRTIAALAAHVISTMADITTLIEYVNTFVAADHIPNWTLPATGSMLYLATIAVLKWATSAGFLVKGRYVGIAVAHNLVLIVLSAMMFAGGVHSLHERYALEGFDGIFCSQRPQPKVLDGAAGFWVTVFFYSKFYELLDTVLMCLKHRATPFLHVYHHVVMLWLTWSWVYFGWLEGSLWCVIVNSLIHTFMYSHYLASVLGVSAWWKKYLTSGQLVQFVTGTAYVSVYAYHDLSRASSGVGGCGSVERRYTALAASVVNITFIILFAMFFRDNYVKPKDQPKEGKKTESKKD